MSYPAYLLSRGYNTGGYYIGKSGQDRKEHIEAYQKECDLLEKEFHIKGQTGQLINSHSHLTIMFVEKIMQLKKELATAQADLAHRENFIKELTAGIAAPAPGGAPVKAVPPGGINPY